MTTDAVVSKGGGTAARMPASGSPRTVSGPMSLWAVAAFVVGMIPVPPLCLIAPLLGLTGLSQVRHKGYQGTKFAVAGIVLGAGATLGWLGGAWWWNQAVRSPLLDGPVAPLRAGLRGDTAAFVARFHDGRGEGLSASASAEAEAFLSEVRGRYGRLEGSKRSPEQEFREQPARLVEEPRLAWLFTFETGPVGVEGVYTALEPTSGAFVNRWRWIVLRDEALGDLVFPRALAGEASLPMKVGEPAPPPEAGAAPPPDAGPGGG